MTDTTPDTLGTQALLLLDRAIAQAERLGRHDLAEHLRRERRHIVEPTCQVLVVGEFKKGKSALVNALLDASVCAVDAHVATAVPTVVRYGPALSATMLVGNGDAAAAESGPSPLARRPIPLAEVQMAATERGEAAWQGRIQSVEVEVQHDLLRSGLVLIDTPGMFGGLTAAHAATTLRALAMADAVVFVSDASQEYSAPELELLRQVAATCPTVICALTKTDFYPEWRRILELDRAHLRRAGIDYEILPLAAPLRHHALHTGDTDLDVESGYPVLSDYLRSHVLADKEALGVRSAAASVRASLGQIADQLTAEHASLSDPAATGALLEQLERAQRAAEELRGAAAGWQLTLNDRFGDMASNVEMDLAVRMRKIRKEATDRIEETDPASTWTDLERWLYQRTNEDLIAHFNELQAQAGALAAEVARHFELDAGEVAPHLDLTSGESPSSPLHLGEHHFQRPSWVELGIIVVRGSVTSNILTGMVATIGTVVGISALALWLAPATLALGATLGRKALQQAREAQLRVRRAEATRAVQTYLEEAELLARKDSRDTVRRVNRRLRDYFGARAEELHVSASRSLEAAARAAQADQATRRQRLEQTAADLRSLRALLGAAARLQQAATPLTVAAPP
jgi:hypothetical protein